MGWVTIYITGKADFRSDIGKKLEDSDLKIMSGYAGGPSDQALFSDLYWVDEKVKLQDIKEAIGSKLVWKYRLRFHSMEAFIESQKQRVSSELSQEERALLEEMVASVYKAAS
jgi:hypothetical protein